MRAHSMRRIADECDEAHDDRVEMQWKDQNEILTYITYYYQRNSTDVIKEPWQSFIRSMKSAKTAVKTIRRLVTSRKKESDV